MGILAWILLGLVAGALAKFIMPGQQGGGIILTIVLGVVGALVGGFLGTYVFGFGDISRVRFAQHSDRGRWSLAGAVRVRARGSRSRITRRRTWFTAKSAVPVTS